MIVIAATVVLLFTTVTLAGPCRPLTQTQTAPTLKPTASKAAVAKPVVMRTVAAIAHVVAQVASAPHKVPRVRAAMAQALLRLPTQPLTSLVFILLLCIASVPLFRRARAVADGSPRLSHGQYRALLQVFLI